MAKVSGCKVVSVAFAILVIVFTISGFVDANNEKIERYELFSALPDITSSTYLVKIREKRDAVETDQTHQYESVNGPNATATVAAAGDISTTKNNGVTVNSSIVLNNAPNHLLGVNGAGQRRYPNETTTTTTTANQQSDSKKSGLLGSAQPALPPQPVTESIAEQLADKVDVPENDTLKELEHEGYSVNQTTDHHQYYLSRTYTNTDEANKIWQSVKNIQFNSMLSQAHRRAMTVDLSFDFPFYGYPVRNITVATGGFLYTGEYVHSWLAATQYIAPLMANFDTSIFNDSYVRLNDNGTAFTVLWENVPLQDKPDVGKFTFSATLHKNGDIVFTYFNVPILVNAIKDDKHPVKVGLSDAYIIDKVVFFARRKTIYEYHRVNFANTEINNSTIIRLTALPTCLSYTDCVSCINHATNFDCAWCPVMNRCSSGTERKKQDWLQRNCDKLQIRDEAQCPALGAKGNNAANTTNNDEVNRTNMTTNKNGNVHDKGHDVHDEHDLHGEHDHDHDDEDNYHTLVGPASAGATASAVSKASSSSVLFHGEETPHHQNMSVVMGIFVPIALVSLVLIWIVYAYRHPHTKSGQLLIQYRPSTWSWRRGEARYTAATIHM